MTSLVISWALYLIAQIFRFTHKRQCHPDVQNSRDGRGHSCPMGFYKNVKICLKLMKKGPLALNFHWREHLNHCTIAIVEFTFVDSFWLCTFLSTKEGWIWNGSTTGSVIVLLITGTKKWCKCTITQLLCFVWGSKPVHCFVL